MPRINHLQINITYTWRNLINETWNPYSLYMIKYNFYKSIPLTITQKKGEPIKFEFKLN